MKRSINVITRSEGIGKYAAAEIREKNLLPGILFGPLIKNLQPLPKYFLKLTKAEKFKVPHTRGVLIKTPMNQIIREMNVRGESVHNTLYDIYVDDEKEPRFEVVMKDLAVHPLTRLPTAVNFCTHSPDKGTKLNIPIYYKGEEYLDGFVEKTERSMYCLVRGPDIPVSLQCNVLNREPGDKLFSYDIEWPDNVDPVPIKKYVNQGAKIFIGRVLKTTGELLTAEEKEEKGIEERGKKKGQDDHKQPPKKR